ncbi:MAG: hypothetical protein IT425_13875 [Pirellulales bacterium]|nr:hypothetical protein [Pirellulales bacterium]
MSLPHMRPTTVGDPFTHGAVLFSAPNAAAIERHPFELNEHPCEFDLALDARLRNVPLPSDMMERLQQLACKLCDESADQVDFLGC